MVQLECIEAGCSHKTQDLEFDQAEKLLNMHLDRAHPVVKPATPLSPPTMGAPPAFTGSRSSATVNVNISFNESYFVFLTGFPLTVKADHLMSLFSSAGCPGEVCLVETEAGKLTGEAVIRVNSVQERDCVLNYDYSQLFGVNILSKETNSNMFFKFAKKSAREPAGKNLYIRLKGMEWQRTEDDVRGFLSDADVEKVIMTKTSTGRSTGEAFVKLRTEADTEIAKKKNRQYLGRRFVIIEEVYEEQFNIAEGGIEPSPARVLGRHISYENDKIMLKNLPNDATEEGIINFLKTKGECNVESVKGLDHAKHLATVVCSSEKDVTRGLTCNNSTYNKNPIIVEKIPK